MSNSVDPRITEILGMMEQLGNGNLAARLFSSGQNDDLDQIIAGLNLLAERFSGQLAPQIETEQRVDAVMEVILAIASLDFTKKAPIGDDGNVFDAIGLGLNALSEELLSTTVSRDFLDSIINSIGDAVIATDANGSVIRLNPVAEALTGWHSGEARGKPLSEIFQIINAHTRETAVNPVHEVLEKGIIVGLANHTVLIARDGTEYQIADSAAPIRNNEGQIKGVVLVFRDVTEAYHTREALQQSEESLRTTLDSIGDAVIATDIQGNVTRLNPVAEKLTGWVAIEAQGQPLTKVFDIVSAQTGETAVNPVAQVLETGKIVGLANHTVLIARDGTEYQIADSAAPIKDDAGQITGVVLVFRDVTEEYEMQEKLRSSEFRNRRLLEAFPDLIFVLSEDGTFIDYHATDDNLLYAPPELFLGKKMEDVLPPEIAVAFHDSVEKVIATGKLQIHAYPLFMGGQRNYFEARFIPYDHSNVLAIVQNITERRNMQELAVQNEKMLSVGGLAAGMAHEINNPLAGMMQTASVMSNRLTNLEMPANQRAAEAAGISMEAIRTFMESRGIPRMLTAVDQSGRRIAKIVENMLSFARKGDATFLQHNMVDLLDKTLELAATDFDLKKQYDFKTIEIVKEYEADLPPVPCERGKMQQVLLNILRNGAQAMQLKADAAETGSKPRFILRLRHEKDAGWVRIEIEDNGPGMEDTTRKRVFEPFFTTKPVGVGTGLGLSVSYFIVTENHNGEMEVVSELGKGATFIIRLPVSRKEELP
ncbi:MAG: PAS domain-containing protein [Ardenticatenaceae bacterium]|nr:PAS domain-containing protein [Ardenticatenaceae bacterium]